MWDPPTIIALATLVSSVGAVIVSIIAALRADAAAAGSHSNSTALVSVKNDVVSVKSDVKELAVNTNSIKDALIKSTAEREYARGGKDERDKQDIKDGLKAVATLAERDQIAASTASTLPK